LTGIIMGGAFNFTGFRLLGVFLTVIALVLVFISLRFRDSKQLDEPRTSN